MRFAATILAFALALLAPLLAAADAPLINATIEPTQIALGESAQLTITASGDNLNGVRLPQVPGLDFRVVGNSRRIQIINGATLATMSVIVRVTPQQVGTYTIPGITQQPLVLRVNPEGQAPSGRAGLGGAGSANPGVRMTADGSAFARLVLPKRDIYVGESIPVDIEVGMRDGFVSSLNGLPTLTGGDFTLNNLSHQPERSERIIDGKPYTVFTWHSIVAAVKPGKFSLAAQSPLTVRIRQRSPRESMLDDMLGDPFLQNFFGATVPKDITVTSPPADLTVLELPTAGRPEDFSGAVGQFKISSELSAKSAAAGDPLTLSMRITGTGNFDRVDSNMLQRVDDWKTYAPKSTFKADDALGNKGQKIFEQPVIAEHPGEQTLPGLSFSYFDPTTRRYQTARTQPVDVTITPSLADSAGNAPPATATAGTPGNAQASGAAARNGANGNAAGNAPGRAPRDGLRPDHAIDGSREDSLVPLALQPRFLALTVGLALAIGGAWLVVRRRPAADGSSPAAGWLPRRRSAAAKATERMMKDLEAAAATGDAKRFFGAARSALQRTLAARWGLPPAAVTTVELDARLDPATLDHDGATPADGPLGADGPAIRRLFALADEIDYAAGATAGAAAAPGARPADFPDWVALVRRVVERNAAPGTPPAQTAARAGAVAAMVLLGVAGLLAGGPRSEAAAPADTAASTPDVPAGTSVTATPASAGYSAAALYNLGNAYARQAKPAQAVLNYERARLLTPDDPDIAANLAQVRKVAHLTAEPASPLYAAATAVSPPLAAWAAVAGVLLLGASLFLRHRRGLRVLAALAGLALVTLTAANAAALWPLMNEGVILTSNAPVRVSPVPMGDPLFTLPEAETVRITAEHEGFLLVKTRAGQTGWVSSADLARVVPRAPG
jgi:tetratricopeptide (TPR) repeat protein